MSYLFTNEIVFCGHPDKICDQISDSLLDAYMIEDRNSRCAIEVAGTRDFIFVAGEVTSKKTIDIESTVKNVLSNYYDLDKVNKYHIINNLNIQSVDIARGVNTGGAGDQGMVFGYASTDTDEMLPLAQVILQDLSKRYYNLALRDNRFKFDGKAQITGRYNNFGVLKEIETFLISYHNDEKDRAETDCIIQQLILDLCCDYRIDINDILINPTGSFSIGGFDSDSGLTGRKIIVDTYHSFCRHGGGAFSGKDPTKVDRSGSYMARKIAKEILNKYKDKLGLYWVEIQVAYAIGIARPVSINIFSNIGQIDLDSLEMEELYDRCKPLSIINELNLRSVSSSESGFNYNSTAMFGHFGNKDFSWEKI